MATDYLLSPLNSGNLNNKILGYSPNDFYYKNAGVELNDTVCNVLSTIPCETITADNKQTCLIQAYCTNRDMSNKLQEIQNQNNGANKKYDDTNLEYDFIIYNIINLGIGVFAMVGFILFFKPMKNYTF